MPTLFRRLLPAFALIAIFLGAAERRAKMQESQPRSLPGKSVQTQARSVDERKLSTADLPSRRYGIDVRSIPVSHRLTSIAPADAKPASPNQIGLTRAVEIVSRTSGFLVANDDGSRLRILAIQSPGALEMRVHFEEFDLPEGGEVYVYSVVDNSPVHGPYLNEGNMPGLPGAGKEKKGDFWTGTIPGDIAIIEYHFTGAEGGFAISGLVHNYQSFLNPFLNLPGSPNQTLDCHVDAKCTNDPLNGSVARINYVKPDGSFLCSATILNTRTADFPAYLLTANHCVSTSEVARTVEALWQFQSTFCNSGQASPGLASEVGAYLLNTERSSDQTLLRIWSRIHASYHSGWDAGAKVFGTDVYGLHHPRGAYLRRSTGTIIDTDAICNASGLVDGYIIDWHSGTVEPGSSGSGIFFNNDFLVGVSSCGDVGSNGQPFCDGNAFYGKFSNFYHDIESFLEHGDYGIPGPPVVRPGVSFIINGTLSSGDPDSRMFGVGWRSDSIPFNGLAGQQLTAELDSSTFDPVLFLLAPVTREILAFDDDSGPGVNSLLTARLPSDGEYLLVVTSFRAGETGSYQLRSNACSYTITPDSRTLAPAGGSGSFSVSTGGSCNWEATRDAAFITITSGASGSGNGTVNYTVVGNGNSRARQGEIRIGEERHTVKQYGTGSACTITPISPGQSINGSLSVSDCFSPFTSGGDYYADLYGFNGFAGQQIAIAMSSSSFDTFLLLIGPNGLPLAEDDDGGGGLNSRIPAGSGFYTLPVTGSYRIQAGSFRPSTTGGYTLSISGPACSYTISPTSQSFNANGGSGSVTVTAGGGCGWSATSQAGFVAITSGASGNGNGVVNFSVSANSGTVGRTGTLSIAGQTFTVTQAGSSCSYSVSPLMVNVSSGGGTGTISVTTTGGCSWSATSGANFISITSGAGGVGNGIVGYLVVANPNASLRVGTLTIAGHTLTITQDAAVSPPSFAYLGKIRDRVGRSKTGLAADGDADGVFAVGFTQNTAPRTITSIQIVRTGAGAWDTDPTNGLWVAGVADNLDAPLRNNPNGSIGIVIGSNSNLTIFVSDNAGLFGNGAHFTIFLRFTDGTFVSSQTTITVVVPTAPQLTYLGKLRDRVGRSKTALAPDGDTDAVFTVNFASDIGARTITTVQLVRAGAGAWDTDPDNGLWVAGVADNLDAPLRNNSNGSLTAPINNGSSLTIFVSDNVDLFSIGVAFTITIRFADGLSLTASTTTSAVPLLTFNGRLRDRVGRGKTALAPDGDPDGVFTVSFPAGFPLRTITSLLLVRTGAGAWDTDPGSGLWVAGVADNPDAPLRNNPNGSISVSITGGNNLTLFLADNAGLFATGAQFTLTIRFTDGASRLAATAITATPPPAPILVFNGQLRDRVGPGKTALSGDGTPDGVFTLAFQPGTGARTVIGLLLVRTGGGAWDTNPASGLWVIGTSNGADAPLHNSPDGSVHITVGDGASLTLFVSDNAGLFNPGAHFIITVYFSDGTTVSAQTTASGGAV
ncbi:MAG: hypothetical protein KF868_10530 [Acidobacteria bacterium]|nr:hypothetical protein [Acidobacteriota bacterium]